MSQDHRCRVRRIRPSTAVDTASVELPRSARSLPLRVACLRAPGSALPGLRRTDPVSLAIGARGEAPDVVFAPDTPVCVVETRVDLTAHRRHFDVDGRLLRTRSGAVVLELQWGVVTPRGHFLLLSGLRLRLPTFVAGSASAQVAEGLALTATLSLSDPDGTLRHGVVPADDVSWLLVSDTPAARTA